MMDAIHAEVAESRQHHAAQTNKTARTVFRGKQSALAGIMRKPAAVAAGKTKTFEYLSGVSAP
jgi:uncharacterized phage protein gp47/JayE